MKSLEVSAELATVHTSIWTPSQLNMSFNQSNAVPTRPCLRNDAFAHEKLPLDGRGVNTAVMFGT